MAQRGKPKRVQAYWHLFEKMQRLIDSGIARSQNDAAVQVATKHWKETPSKSFESCIRWLKDNQCKFRDELRLSTGEVKGWHLTSPRIPTRWNEEWERRFELMREKQRRFDERQRLKVLWDSWSEADEKAAFDRWCDEVMPGDPERSLSKRKRSA
jgi:hypothetical protein